MSRPGPTQTESIGLILTRAVHCGAMVHITSLGQTRTTGANGPTGSSTAGRGSTSVDALGVKGAPTPIMLSIDAVDEALRALDQLGRRVLGVNNSDVLALQLIGRRHRRGQLTQVRDLIPGLGVSTGTATTMVQRLGRAGLLESRPHDTDRRARLLHVTAKADDLIEGLLGPVRTGLDALLQSIDQREQMRLIELLDEVREVLTTPSAACSADAEESAPRPVHRSVGAGSET